MPAKEIRLFTHPIKKAKAWFELGIVIRYIKALPEDSKRSIVATFGNVPNARVRT